MTQENVVIEVGTMMTRPRLQNNVNKSNFDVPNDHVSCHQYIHNSTTVLLGSFFAEQITHQYQLDYRPKVQGSIQRSSAAPSDPWLFCIRNMHMSISRRVACTTAREPLVEYSKVFGPEQQQLNFHSCIWRSPAFPVVLAVPCYRQPLSFFRESG